MTSQNLAVPKLAQNKATVERPFGVYICIFAVAILAQSVIAMDANDYGVRKYLHIGVGTIGVAHL